MGKFSVLGGGIVCPVCGPIYRKHDVVNLRPQPANIHLDQEWIHGSDSGTAVSRERGLAHVVELCISKKTDLDAIPRQDDRLSSFGKIVSAADMGNACGRKGA